MQLSCSSYLRLYKAASESYPDFSLGVLVGYESEAHSESEKSPQVTVTECFIIPDEDDDVAEYVNQYMEGLKASNQEGYILGLFIAGNIIGGFPIDSQLERIDKISKILSQSKPEWLVVLDLASHRSIAEAPRAFKISSSAPISLQYSSRATLDFSVSSKILINSSWDFLQNSSTTVDESRNRAVKHLEKLLGGDSNKQSNFYVLQEVENAGKKSIE
jgi:hypothetical protein